MREKTTTTTRLGGTVGIGGWTRTALMRRRIEKKRKTEEREGCNGRGRLPLAARVPPPSRWLRLCRLFCCLPSPFPPLYLWTSLRECVY